MPGRNTGKTKAVGNRPRRRSGRPGFRRGPANVAAPVFDEFGLPTDSKYRALGPRNRRNVAVAIGEGFVYGPGRGTTEEQCCYGELRRRGFTRGEGSGPRCFEIQFPVAGSVIDFRIWDRGEDVALRPSNKYWHGHATELRDYELAAEDLEQAGLTVYDIWDGDSLADLGIEARFDLFFGR